MSELAFEQRCLAGGLVNRLKRKANGFYNKRIFELDALGFVFFTKITFRASYLQKNASILQMNAFEKNHKLLIYFITH
jgi:hypothetical protein